MAADTHSRYRDLHVQAETNRLYVEEVEHVNDRLRARITALEEERDALRASLDDWHEWYNGIVTSMQRVPVGSLRWLEEGA